MSLRNTLASINSSKWAITQAHATDYLRVLDAALDSDQTDVSPKAAIASYENADAEKTEIAEYDDKIAIVRIEGAIMKSGWCNYGTEDYANYIENTFADDESIKGMLLIVDSGGGQVAGTQRLYKAIQNAQKPIIGLASSVAASAGYWIVAPTQKIFIESETDEVGSIGAFVSFSDYSEYFKEAGIKRHEIYARKSSNKNKEVREALKDNYTPMLDNVLDPLVDIFIKDIKTARPNISEEVFSGGIYIAERAIQVGLVDDIKSEKEAMEYLRSQINSNNSQPQQTQIYMSKLTIGANIMKKLGFGDATEKETSLEVNQSGLTKLDAALQELQEAEESNQKLTSEKSELSKKVKDLEAEKLVLEQKVTELKAKNEEYSKVAAASPAAPVSATQKTETADTTPKDDDIFAEFNAKVEADFGA
ncbi:S49 family peptidase [Bernardetia sp. ABR2-2B]|uniref:S49 family peptidase n=1 Tax=Bernardetia sp. ABR2-2B TaxID=3127472 RepID=UPI0030D339DB